MAYLWFEDLALNRWFTVPLTGDAWILSTSAPKVLQDGHPTGSGPRPTMMVRRQRAADSQWILLAGREAHLRVNGAPMAFVTHILQDYDEILIGDSNEGSWQRCFFSAARAVSVTPFPADADPVACSHCEQPILAGQSTVQCPACGLWHHQLGNGQSCWTLAQGCAACGCRAPVETPPRA